MHCVSFLPRHHDARQPMTSMQISPTNGTRDRRSQGWTSHSSRHRRYRRQGTSPHRRSLRADFAWGSCQMIPSVNHTTVVFCNSNPENHSDLPCRLATIRTATICRTAHIVRGDHSARASSDVRNISAAFTIPTQSETSDEVPNSQTTSLDHYSHPHNLSSPTIMPQLIHRRPTNLTSALLRSNLVSRRAIQHPTSRSIVVKLRSGVLGIHLPMPFRQRCLGLSFPASK